MKTQDKFLAKGIMIGYIQSKIVGYYHYDSKTDKHYICDEKTLFRYEVYENSVELLNEM